MNYEPLFTTYSQLSFVDPTTENTSSHNGKSMKAIRQDRYPRQEREHFDVIDDNDIEQVARDEQEERDKEILRRRVDESSKKEAEKAKQEIEKARQEEAKAKQALSELQNKQAELERRFADMEARQRAMPVPPMGGQGGPPQMGGARPPQASAEEFNVLKGQPGVKILNPTDLNGIISDIESVPVCFVWFYAPWCGFCTRLIPTMVDVVKQMNGRIPIYLVNADNQPDIGRNFKIQGFPTLNAYKGNSGSPITYNGDRSANDIVSFLNNQLA